MNSLACILINPMNKFEYGGFVKRKDGTVFPATPTALPIKNDKG